MELRRDDVKGARTVRARAVVEFEAYVLPSEQGYGLSGEHSLAERIRHELTDAIQYRAPHLTDVEPGDALIAMRRIPYVEVDHVVDRGEADPDAVVQIAVGNAGEVFL